MSLSVNTLNSSYTNNDYLRTVRNLQSLGVDASGNPSYDRQNLQVAEYSKRQDLLANPTTALNNAQVNFQSTISQMQNIGNVSPTQPVGNVNATNSTQAVSPSSDATKIYPEQQVGATQLGELNKIRLGIVA